MSKILVLIVLLLTSGCALFHRRETLSLNPEKQRLELELFAGAPTPEFPYTELSHPESSLEDVLKVEVNSASTKLWLSDEQDKYSIPALEILREDQPFTRPVAIDLEGKSLFLVDSRGRESAALVRLDLATQRPQLLAADPLADVQDILYQPEQKRIEAVSFEYDKKHWVFLDRRIESHFKKLQSLDAGEMSILKRSADLNYWLVEFRGENRPAASCVYDTEKQQCTAYRQAEFSGPQHQIQTSAELIRARDGLRLMFFTTSQMLTTEARPVLFWIDHGPGQRFQKNYPPFHRYFAEAGYLVVSVNYRGSAGLGKKIYGTGKAEDPALVAQDFADTLQWLVQQKKADPLKVALVGWADGAEIAQKISSALAPQLRCGQLIEREHKKRSEVLVKTPLLYHQCR